MAKSASKKARHAAAGKKAAATKVRKAKRHGAAGKKAKATKARKRQKASREAMRVIKKALRYWSRRR